MKQGLFALLIFTSLSVSTLAQSPVSTRLGSGVDAGITFKTGRLYPSITYYQLLHLDSRRMFSIGWTTKVSAFYGNNVQYTTAPANLTRGESGFSALSAPLIPANIDTISFAKASVTSLNFGIRAQVRIGIVELGGSADVFGFAFGKGRIGRYRSSTGGYQIFNGNAPTDTLSFRANPQQSATPSRFNARLLGDNDRGTLATELFARVRVNQRMSVKVGYQWVITEMRARNRNIVDENNRFRNRAGMPYVALTFPLFL